MASSDSESEASLLGASESSDSSWRFYHDDEIPQHAAMFQAGVFWNRAFSWEELLDAFDFESFVKVTKWMNARLLRRAENRSKAKDAEDIEEIELRRRMREEKWAAMTPFGRRPLGEPPIMPWDTIFREDWSEAGLSALFPGDPEKTARAKDLWGELLALRQYSGWTSNEHLGVMWKGPAFTRQFYHALQSEVWNDKELIQKEWRTLWDTATKLGKFEQQYLDTDGGTKRIEFLLRSGTELLGWQAEEVRAKYQHLAPTGYDATPLAMFEYKWFLKDGDTSKLEEALKGYDGEGFYWTFCDTPDEVRDKYGYVVERLLRSEELSPTLKSYIHRYLNSWSWKIPSSSDSEAEGTESGSRWSAEAQRSAMPPSSETDSSPHQDDGSSMDSQTFATRSTG